MQKEIIIILLFIIIVQMSLSFFQIRYYEKFMRRLHAKYAGRKGFFLDTDVVKKIGGSALVVLITDSDYYIHEAYKYSGLSILAKFKKLIDLKDIKLTDNKFDDIVSKQERKIAQALHNVKQRRMKPEKELQETDRKDLGISQKL